ncbi:Serine/threonine-protein kinase StkP [Urbifossiella limnaea]|uniref:Serine/threonine-protein kinase StkP n=1 Tax=Urbifossiella limnaea TaxID=2528023 RepID=A0A517XW22_9BACT|nr:protein kinase [Urbifossiella limnaea]QDU21708.1 Serine/threonine-protein kinase StkP [Urbifossiella limnaea]
MFTFFSCVAEAVVENGVKGLATMVPGGSFALAVAGGALAKYRERIRDAALRDEIARMAAVTATEARKAAAEAVQAAAGGASVEERLVLESYLAQIPAAVTQSLKRPSDPTGKTVPAAFTLTTPDDVLRLLPPRPPRFHPGDALVGRPEWHLDRVLGVGGFGEVWLARHTDMGVEAAVKFCHGPQAADLRHESRVIAQVMRAGDHPSVVPLRDAVLTGDTPWLRFDYVDGGDVGDWIRHLHRRPAGERLKYVVQALRQIATAVGAFHRLTPAVVHRDLKPSNILYDRAGKRLRVTDFGIGAVTAKATLAEDGSGGATQGGRMLSSHRGSHTPLYASPQQRAGADPDPRDDVHALGVIAYQMLTGHLSQGPGPDYAHDLADVGTPPPLVDLIGRCVAQNPARRPATAADLAAELAPLASGAVTVPPTAPPVATPVAPFPLPPISAIDAKPTPKVEPTVNRENESEPVSTDTPAVAHQSSMLPVDDEEFGTTDDYLRAFEAVLAEGIPDIHLDLLRKHYAAPDHTATWARLAAEVGYANGSAVNLQYGKLAARIAARLGVKQPPRGFWLYVLAGWAAERDPDSGHTAFTLRRPVNEALRRLGLLTGTAVKLLPDELSAVVERELHVAVSGNWRMNREVKPFARWKLVTKLPAKVKVRAGEVYKLDIMRSAKDANVQGLATLVDVEALNELDLTGCKRLTNDGFALAAKLTQVRTLLLPQSSATDATLKLFTMLPQLETLDIEETTVTDAGLAHVRAMRTLVDLRLGGSDIGDAGLVWLSPLPHLQTLGLDQLPITDAGLSTLTGLSRLEALGLPGTNISDDGMIHLLKLSELWFLDLGGTQITETGLAQLAKMQKLRDLRLTGCKHVSDSGLSWMARMTSLELLDLSDTMVTDLGIVALKSAPVLESLNLENCLGVTDASVDHLIAMKPLELLNLTGTSVTPAGASRLSDARPDCTIYHPSFGEQSAPVADATSSSEVQRISKSSSRVAAQGTGTPNPNPTRTVYFFLWNPKLDPNSFADYDEVQRNALLGQPYSSQWICPSTRPRPGDVAIMQRTGNAHNGVFAKGIVTSEPFDDDGTRVVELSLDSFLPIGKEIPREEIVREAKFTKNWAPMSSGNVVPEPITQAILSLWGNRVQEEATPP